LVIVALAAVICGMTVARVQRDFQVSMADDKEELAKAIEQGADLLLLNRQLDWGFDETEGTALISSLRAKYPELKMMLVSNYPEAQAEALAAGALPGFGKRELGTERVTKLLREAIMEPAAPRQE